jgi:hypothetical protein
VLWSASTGNAIEKLSTFVTASADASALESRVGHYYEADDTYFHISQESYQLGEHAGS